MAQYVTNRNQQSFDPAAHWLRKHGEEACHSKKYKRDRRADNPGRPPRYNRDFHPKAAKPLCAKGNGYDVKALRTIVRMRKQDANERQEHETILETYTAMEATGDDLASVRQFVPPMIDAFRRSAKSET